MSFQIIKLLINSLLLIDLLPINTPEADIMWSQLSPGPCCPDKTRSHGLASILFCQMFKYGCTFQIISYSIDLQDSLDCSLLPELLHQPEILHQPNYGTITSELFGYSLWACSFNMKLYTFWKPFTANFCYKYSCKVGSLAEQGRGTQQLITTTVREESQVTPQGSHR